MRDGSRNRLAEVAVGSLGVLCVVLVVVGVVSVAAEFLGTWQYYFVMERAIAYAAPVVVLLSGTVVVTGVVAAIRADSG